MYVDLPEPELRAYRSEQVDPDDFDEFWSETLADARTHDWAPTLELVDSGLSTIDVYDVTFPGFGGHPVKAWLRVPAGTTTPLPTVVEFQGYGGGRGHPFDNLLWSSAGFAHLMMDTRGQGSVWGGGDTPDPVGTGPQSPGFLTRGIDSRDTYYYRRVYTDAVRTVDAARGFDVVDASRLAIGGGSQGGGITLAVAGLVPDVAAALPRVPFLCDFPRATTITDGFPYKEVGVYLAVHREKVAKVHEVLSYFDGVNFARRASTPAWFSTALMDPTCPPSTVFGAYNAYAGPKQIEVWPYNGHEGGQVYDDVTHLAVLRELFG